MAKSLAIEAIRDVRGGNYDLAKGKLEEGSTFMTEAHHAHTELIQKEANDEKVEFSLIK